MLKPKYNALTRELSTIDNVP